MTKTVTLGEICEKVSNCNPVLDHKNSSFTYIDIASVDRFSKSIIGTNEILGLEAPSRARQIVRLGDVLVSTVRPNLNAVALVTVEYDKAIASTGFCVLRAKKDVVSSDYIFRYTQSKIFVDEMVEKATGASYPAVSDAIIKHTPIPLPSLPEQRRIAALLDHADALRQKDRQLLAHYDTLAQSVFIDLFGNEKFELYEVRQVVKLVGGNAFKSSDYVDNGLPLVRIGTVNKGYFDFDSLMYLPSHYADTYKRYILRPGDLVMTLTGTVGKDDYGNIFRIGNQFEHYLLNQRVAKFEYNKSLINSQYLLYYFKQTFVKQDIMGINRGVRQANISNEDIYKHIIPLPPLPLQTHFASVIEAIEQQKAVVRRQMAASEALFGRLLQESFP